MTDPTIITLIFALNHISQSFQPEYNNTHEMITSPTLQQNLPKKKNTCLPATKLTSPKIPNTFPSFSTLNSPQNLQPPTIQSTRQDSF